MKCKNCNHETSNKKFCSRSCSVSYNNKLRNVNGNTRLLIPNTESSLSGEFCINCKNKIPENHRNEKIYCNRKCHKEHQYTQNVEKWLNGVHPGYKGKTLKLCSFVRKYIHETRGTACEKCGWDEKHPVDGAVLTEIEHKDGDASNNELSNLEVLCPNCHSKTATYKARNKNSARKRYL